MWPNTMGWPQSEIADCGVSDQRSCLRCWDGLLNMGQEAEGRGGAHCMGCRVGRCAAGPVHPMVQEL